LAPVIDGRVTDFFEWRGAGAIDPSPPLGAMWKASRLFSAIRFAFSLEAFYLRLDQDDQALAGQPGTALELHVVTRQSAYKLVLPLGTPAEPTGRLWRARLADGRATEFSEVGPSGLACRDKIIEAALPFKDLDLQAGEEFRVQLVVTQEGLEAERYPRHQPLALTVPDRDYDARQWKV